jgi:predicted AAA+ superfamily ATPase
MSTGYAILRRNMAYQPRFFEPPAGSFFLFGPRGTGKTTLLRRHFGDALWVNLLRPEVYRELQARPERLRERVLGAPQARDVVIDEVQRVPELLNVVHDLIEDGPPRRYVLTGSSARKLRRGGVDLLAGRAAVRYLHPFLAAEWPRFSLDASLELGLVPLIVDAADPADALAAYVTLYLEQEVQAEGVVRNVGQFARFLEAISFSHAAVLNLANVARDAQAKQRTVAGYLDVVEDLLLAFHVPVFRRRAKRATAVHPKLYLFDTGVFRSLRPRGPIDRPEEIAGAALEGLVAQQLRAWIDYSQRDFELFTWRTRSAVEVDFIVYGRDGLWSIEVTNGRQIHPEHLRGLKAFREDYPESAPMLLYRGEDRLVRDGIACVPIEEFLRDLRPGHLLQAAL